MNVSGGGQDLSRGIFCREVGVHYAGEWEIFTRSILPARSETFPYEDEICIFRGLVD